MNFERRRYDHTHMNIAPLVDVVFLLLLFFMLTSHLMQEPAIKIKLPEAKTSESTKDTVKTIFIDKDNRIYYLNNQVDIKGLGEQINRSLNKENEFIRIKADRHADVGVLVSVIDEIRILGVKNYSIVTERQF
ncbi:MAG: biopolymer transporter ExbD [Thermodesulfovibrionales bacterium]